MKYKITYPIIPKKFFGAYPIASVITVEGEVEAPNLEAAIELFKRGKLQ